MDSIDVVILASEDGSRFGSALPRAVQPVLFQPMVSHLLGRAAALPCRRVLVVVPRGDVVLRDACAGDPMVEFVERADGETETVAALRALDGASALLVRADAVLLETETLRGLAARCAEGAALAFAGVGRDGPVLAACLAPGARGAAEGCASLEALLGAPWRDGELSRVALGDPSEGWLVEDAAQLWRVQRRLQRRINRGWIAAGVTLLDPRATWIDARTVLEPGALIEPEATLVNARIERGVYVERAARIVDTSVGQGTRVRQGSVLDSSRIGPGCELGPYARLRPGCVLGRGVKVGNFVEVKNSVLADGVKASHLSYIGDAAIGRDVNVGCGFITCNYDGVRKNRTIVEDGVFIGSDCQAVAPVRLGAGSYVAAGTTLTRDVPPGALAIGRARQVNKEGCAEACRARAARRAVEG